MKEEEKEENEGRERRTKKKIDCWGRNGIYHPHQEKSLSERQRLRRCDLSTSYRAIVF